MDFYEDDEQNRVQWRAPRQRTSPVTGQIEQYVPYGDYLLRITIGNIALFASLLFLASITVLNITIKLLVRDPNQFNSLIPTAISGAFTVLQIALMNPLYDYIALAINQFENSRTDTEYVDRLIYKIALAKFLNSFGLILYSAVIKPISTSFNAAWFEDFCTNGSCQKDLVLTIGIVFGGTSFLNLFLELVFP